MKVVDWAKSENGEQRRRDGDNRLLHCCCICGALEAWGPGWSIYCSERELDEERPVAKCCSPSCRERAGPKAGNVTMEMREAAKAKEWREPRRAYREATDIEKYHHAARRQMNPK